MREELARMIQERVGLDEATALQVADTALEFVKSKLPPQVAALLDGGGANLSDAGGLLGGLFGSGASSAPHHGGCGSQREVDMPGFLDRLAQMFGRGSAPATEEAPQESVAVAEPEAPAAVEEAPAAADQAPAWTEPAPVAVEAAAAEAEAAPMEAPAADVMSAAPQAAPEAPVEAATAAPEAPAEPARSPEEELEERLWAETDRAWAAGDFQTVTERLDALKALQPEEAGVIDEKIAAAQYNQASQLEERGELDRALYLYQEAQRRNPDLGEAAFAIERVQASLQPAPAAEVEAAAMAAPAERTYTVEAGDSLSAIAERMYGSAAEWPKIFEANRDQLDNPDLIQPGQALRIP